jgi:multiple sugar transport system permease protein
VVLRDPPNTRAIVSNAIIYVLMVAFALTMLVPFIWMLSASLKRDIDVFTFPIVWIPREPLWRNFASIWTRIPFVTFFLNTIKLTVIITGLQLLTSSFAAYAFAKLQFSGRNVLFIGYVATIALPWQVYMIPQFIMMRQLGLTDTHLALIIIQTFTAFGVFLMRQFYLNVPNELCDAARIDGLSEYGIYSRIMLPLSVPALATLTIFSFVFVWNDFMGPLIYLSSDNKKTIQLGLRLFIQQYGADYAHIMAASLVAMIPVIVLFISFQRFYVQGIATSGLKG